MRELLKKIFKFWKCFHRVIKKFYITFFSRGGNAKFQNKGVKKISKAVYNSDYMPLLKIGGWVFTKISKSKSQKFPYHLHHATISRFTQPHPTISLTSFLTIQPPQITPYFHPIYHKYSPHPNPIPTSIPPQISPTYHSKNIITTPLGFTQIYSNPL